MILLFSMFCLLHVGSYFYDEQCPLKCFFCIFIHSSSWWYVYVNAVQGRLQAVGFVCFVHDRKDILI